MKRPSWGSLVLIGLLSVPILAEDGPDEMVSRITGNLVCTCGCANIVVRSCDCGLAAEMSAEVRQLVLDGKSEEEVYTLFEEKHGVQVLGAPKPEGFNLLAWILPFAALFFGLCIVVVVAKRLSRSADPNAGRKPPQIEAKYRRMLDRELRE